MIGRGEGRRVEVVVGVRRERHMGIFTEQNKGGNGSHERRPSQPLLLLRDSKKGTLIICSLSHLRAHWDRLKSTDNSTISPELSSKATSSSDRCRHGPEGKETYRRIYFPKVKGKTRFIFQCFCSNMPWFFHDLLTSVVSLSDQRSSSKDEVRWSSYQPGVLGSNL